jgi:hypothetical protein
VAARQALESIRNATAVVALRRFLPRAEGRMQLGIIAALGQRPVVAADPKPNRELVALLGEIREPAVWNSLARLALANRAQRYKLGL